MNRRNKSTKAKTAVIVLVILAVIAVGLVLVFEAMNKNNVPTVELPQEVTETQTDDEVNSQEFPTLTGRCGEKAYFVFDDTTNTLTITGSGALWDAGDAELNYWDSFKTQVKVVKIASGITAIGAYSLDSLSKVEEIEISDTVETIETQMGGTALSWSDNLIKITVDKNNSYYSSDDFGVLYNKAKSEIIQFPAGNSATTFEVPSSVRKIGGASFADCTNLKAVTLPQTVEEIGTDAFLGCSEDLIIKCAENSAAHKFAQENMLKYELI